MPTAPLLVVDAGTTTLRAALPSTVFHPGAAREHYERLAGAHAQLWQLLRPTFRALERG